MADLLAVHDRGGIELGDLARYTGRVVGRVEECDGTDARPPRETVLPDLGSGYPVRGDGTQPRDDHAFIHDRSTAPVSGLGALSGVEVLVEVGDGVLIQKKIVHTSPVKIRGECSSEGVGIALKACLFLQSLKIH